MTMQQTILKAPFPYFGGKSAVADLVWQRFGRIKNYVEPFFGSGAVLLGCPYPGHTETVNDLNGFLANFWRALQADPDQVAYYADWPVNEIDLHSRHRSLVSQKAMVEQLIADPDWYDAKVAGWWVWGASAWIGSGWCPASPGVSHMGQLSRQLPHVGDAGQGVNRRSHLDRNPASIADVGNLPIQIPHVGNAGMGVHRASHAHALTDYFQALAARLRRVRVCCGDWNRVMGPSVTFRHGLTAIFLDPPYDQNERDGELYATETKVSADVRKWAIENGDNPLLRIAVCGYEASNYQFPDTWNCVQWKAKGGYGSQGNGRGHENSARECIWFSPHCLDLDALPMFAAMREVPE